jgi:5-methylcytosine-specific restriction endonuclease McrA
MMKACRGCGIEKELADFHVTRANKKDGHKDFCKQCVAERRKVPMSTVSSSKLKCSRCKKTKLREEFASLARAVRGTQDWCKDCMKEYHAKYAQENKEKLRKDAFEWYNRSPRGWASGALRSHKKKGHAINITTDELYNYALDKKTCPVCGKVLSWGGKNGRIRSHSPSLDRINNEPELNINNIWIICARCNAAKGDLNMKEFVEYCKNVVKRSEMGLDPEREVPA